MPQGVHVMRRRTVERLAAVSAALLLPLAQASAQPAPSPVAKFLHAADVNDFAAMRAVLDGGSLQFLKLIGGCYLRAVYSNKETHEIVGAWMCAEGANRSRVVLATLANISAAKVAVTVRSNDDSNRPAPPRTGSAFGN